LFQKEKESKTKSKGVEEEVEEKNRVICEVG